MSFGASDTYIYAYIAFACVYLVASFTFVASALRVSTGLSKARTPATAGGELSSPRAVTLVIDHGQKIVDYTQMSTLLPLVYIVGSMFLGSVISRDTSLAVTINLFWVAFTAACAVASIALAVLGIRESGVITHSTVGGLPSDTPEAVQRIGVRLGVSSALLLLVAVFTMLNLWSILSSLPVLSKIEFLI